MIIGIGTDIIEIERIKKSISNQHFLERYFTKAEIALYHARRKNAEVLAGNFAVKEAVSKVLGTGFSAFSPIDIEVLRNDMGKPIVHLYNKALKQSEVMEINYIHVSISHNRTNVVAFAVGEKR